MTDEDKQPTWMGFGYGEIAFLLSQIETEPAERVRGLFAFEPEAMSQDTLGAALSSLFAREQLVGQTADAVVPQGWAAMLSYAFAEGTHWAQVGLMSADETIDAAIVITAPEATLLLQPRNYGAWIALVKDPTITTARAVLDLARSFLDAHARATVVVDAQWRDGEGSFLVRRDGDEEQIQRGRSTIWEASELSSASHDEIEGLFAQLMSPDLS